MIPVKYINENRDTHEIKTSTYILMIVVTIILLFALADKSHAEQPYNVPPRILSYCEQGYIGYEYSEIKRAKCHKIWGMFNRELILEETIYFSKL